jgi:hypothetical protein
LCGCFAFNKLHASLRFIHAFSSISTGFSIAQHAAGPPLSLQVS